MSWEVVVGIETHAQLRTQSKIFSAAATAFGAPPNTQASAVDIALPGVLPVLNRAAVEHAIRFGLAVGATINRRSIFARKNYFYPDLPKGYQISQYEQPIVQGGALNIPLKGGMKAIRITRAHLEEDAGKSIHAGYVEKGYVQEGYVADSYAGDDFSRIDLNRAGVPLLEIVSEPDLRGAQEAVLYARSLHALVVWIGICDGNMQEGSFRCDANVSVRRPGEPLGTRCEIKNLNSFRFMEQAIEYEAHRQIEVLEDGGKVEQETRLYDPDRNETRSLRTKEEAHDYRYFPDPDLLPLVITEQMITDVKRTMPELPTTVRARFVSYEFPEEMITVLMSDRDKAEDFERFWTTLVTKTKGCDPMQRVQAANWAMMEVAASMKDRGVAVWKLPVSPEDRGTWVARILDGTISHKIAKEIWDAMLNGEGPPDKIIERRGLKQITDVNTIEKLVEGVLAANAQQVADYRAGKQKAFNSLVGQVMKASGGKANPAQVNEILRRKLAR